MCAESQVKIIANDRYHPIPEDAMEFRLVYDGELLGASRDNTRSQHKHEVRKVFHRQLKRLWQVSRQLREWATSNERREIVSVREYLASRFPHNGYHLLPLVVESLAVGCSLDILFLRYDKPGETLLQSGDIDNRLKTIFDALRIPLIGEYCGTPEPDEDPFYCLLQDDSMITHVSVTTDLLLEPTRGKNDVHLVITVKIWPIAVTIDNIAFGGN